MLAERLSDGERQTLVALEGTIKTHLQSFVDVGTALLKIRDERLYREKATTFESYCKAEWGFTRQRASQLIEAAAVVKSLPAPTKKSNDPDSVINQQLSTMVDKPGRVISERVAREVAKAPPEKRAAVVEEAAKSAPKDKDGKPKVTAAQVRRVIKEEAADKPAEQIQLDLADNPLPESLRSVFIEADQHHAEALKLLTRLAGLLNPILGDANGTAPLPAGRHTATQRQQILTDLRNLRTALNQTRPYAVCPYCQAGGKKCPACKELGWVTKGTWEQSPKDMRDQLRSALAHRAA